MTHSEQWRTVCDDDDDDTDNHHDDDDDDDATDDCTDGRTSQTQASKCGRGSGRNAHAEDLNQSRNIDLHHHISSIITHQSEQEPRILILNAHNTNT